MAQTSEDSYSVKNSLPMASISHLPSPPKLLA